MSERAGRARAVLAAALMLAAAPGGALGCTGEEGPESARSEVMELPEAERARGVKACERHAARVCACAEPESESESESKAEPHADADEALVEACALATSRPEALKMALGAAAARGDLEPRDRAAALGTARRIIEKCFEADARLDPSRCPRP